MPEPAGSPLFAFRGVTSHKARDDLASWLLLGGRALRSLRFLDDDLLLRLQRALHIAEHPIALVGADQTSPHGVAHQLLGVLQRKLAEASRCADCRDKRIRHRAPEDGGDPRQSFKQRRDL
jgi:hypothetical protein